MSIKLVEHKREDMSAGVYYFPMLLDEAVDNKEHLPFNVASVVVEAHSESIIEAHQSREVWMMVQGSGIVHSEGKDVAAKPGDVFFFDSFQNHKVNNTGDVDIVLTSLWWPIE